MRRIDLTGMVFGRLKVVSLGSNKGKKRRRHWNCRCSCGTEKSIDGEALRYGLTKSCGCLAKELLAKRSIKHGDTVNYKNSREYKSWCGAKSRCYNKNDCKYKNYGARGITMCDRWLCDYSLFLLDMGRCPKGFSLDRIDVNGNYEPSNCRWASNLTQARNRTDNVWLEYNGERRIESDWARLWGIDNRRINSLRRKYGLSMEQIYNKCCLIKEVVL
jgi:hypothetical protein